MKLGLVSTPIRPASNEKVIPIRRKAINVVDMETGEVVENISAWYWGRLGRALGKFEEGDIDIPCEEEDDDDGGTYIAANQNKVEDLGDYLVLVIPCEAMKEFGS